MKKIYISRKTFWKILGALIIILLGVILRLSIGNSKGRPAEESEGLSSSLETSQTDPGQEQKEGDMTEPEEHSQEEEEVLLGVHVSGAVAYPDRVYYLREGSRIWDAIEKAGGATEEADLSKLNLADHLKDGERIYVPRKGEDLDEYITPPSSQDSREESQVSGLTNINSASKIELMELPGIGEVLAERILEYRQANGDFLTTEDLKNVSGIGTALYEKIREFVTV